MPSVINLQGIYPIVAAPFTDSGEVDYESTSALIRALAKGGCHGLTLFGIAGEYYKLNEEEKDSYSFIYHFLIGEPVFRRY